jgi:amino acid adenylation domain-containing protein
VNADGIEDIYELSPLQQGILFHSLYDGDPEVYVNQRSLFIDGPLDIDVLVQAWQETIHAHPAARTSFHWDGLDKPLQVVHREVPSIVSRYDWSATGDDHDERFHRLLAADMAARFDLAVPPLQRLHVIRLGREQHGIIWTHHLLVMDGWSVPIFVNDVMHRYLNMTVGGSPPPPAPAYRDYIGWLQRQDLSAARDFWVSELAGQAARTLAPLLRAGPQRGGGALDERIVDLPATVESGLRATAARHRVTFNTMLHAALALVLERFSGGDEVMFGSTSSARPAEVPAIERMVGMFTSTLPVRLPVPAAGDVGAWLRDIQARYTAVRRYEYTPLAQIKQWAGVPGPQQLFDCLFIFDNYPLSIEAGPLTEQLTLRRVNAFEKTSEPLVVIATPEPQFTLRVRLHRDRFAYGAADDILACFQRALAALATTEHIETAAAALVPASRAQGTATLYKDADRTVAELVEAQSQATPDAIAVISDDGALSYRELLHRARHAAAALAAAGVTPGQVVGVCAVRSPEMVIGLLGVLLAGAAYLPLDPSLPIGRLAFMISDAGASVVLAQRSTVQLANDAGARQVLAMDNLPAVPAGWIHPRLCAADAAYVMYTSGSTGRPKGVVINAQAIVNRLLWMQETFRLDSGDRVMQKTPFGFDVSVWEFFWPLMTGAAVVLARPGGHQDAEYLARAIRRHRVTTVHFVPSMLGLFLDEPAASDLPDLRRVMCSGEQLPADLAERFRVLLPRVELHNLYGPTEAAVDVTWHDCSRPAAPGVMPIGHPIANTQAYVLDRRLMEAPCHVPGELYIGGVQLARGYLARPGLTAAAFIGHPLAGSGGRLYRTGDKARRLSDGALEFLGRVDGQVKINGYRIELGEIEHILADHHAVREAAVVVRDRAGSQHLAAYVTTTGSQQPEPQALRDYLRLELPRYMLPDTLTILPAMPLTHNGKLDRAALPDTAPAHPAANTAPATPREEAIAAVYREVLDTTDIDVTASFFDLGGNSFDAVRAIRRIEGASVGMLVGHPSARALAVALAQQQCAGPVLLRLTGRERASHTLVCVPFGGGSAVTYQRLARAFPAEMELLTVQLPGHELGGDPALRPLAEVAQECTDAILERADGPVSVYGHCAGVALAVELTRRLEAADRPVERLFVAGSYPFYELGPAGRAIARGLAALVSRGILQVSALTVGTTGTEHPVADQAEMRFLRSIGGFSGELAEEDLAFVMRAFRHDVVAAGRYFSQHWPRRAATPPLAAPITFIAGTDDPMTPRYQRRYRMWERFGQGVELVTVPGGGHYFHQHQAEVVTRIIEERCRVTRTPRRS